MCNFYLFKVVGSRLIAIKCSLKHFVSEVYALISDDIAMMAV